MADLGPYSPGSCSPSLVPYGTEEDSDPEEDQDQQRRTPEQIETKEPAMMKAPAKEGMGIIVGPGDYQPAPPRYVRANEDSEDGQDIDEEEDIEAPYLAPKQAPVPKASQDEKTAQIPSKGSKAPAEDLQESSGEESIPELIDLREEEEVAPPSPLKRAHCPTTLDLPEKTAVTACLLYTSPSPRDATLSRMPSSA